MRNEETKLTAEQKARLVGEATFIKCLICKKNYIPDEKDISLNGNFFYKNCRICRKSRAEMKQKSLNKTKLIK